VSSTYPMAYWVWLIVLATAAFPLAPSELLPGHWTAVPNPTWVFQVELMLQRYRVNMLVVPEPSERWTVVMAWFGRVVLGFRAVIAGSFQFVMVPRKMLAMTVPVRWRPDGMPGRL